MQLDNEFETRAGGLKTARKLLGEVAHEDPRRRRRGLHRLPHGQGAPRRQGSRPSSSTTFRPAGGSSSSRAPRSSSATSWTRTPSGASSGNRRHRRRPPFRLAHPGRGILSEPAEVSTPQPRHVPEPPRRHARGRGRAIHLLVERRRLWSSRGSSPSPRTTPRAYQPLRRDQAHGRAHSPGLTTGPTACVSSSLRYFNASGADPDGALGEMHDPETHLIPNILLSVLGKKARPRRLRDRFPDARTGRPVRDYIHVSDLAAAHVLALRHLSPEATSEAHQPRDEPGVFRPRGRRGGRGGHGAEGPRRDPSPPGRATFPSSWLPGRRPSASSAGSPGSPISRRSSGRPGTGTGKPV